MCNKRCCTQVVVSLRHRGLGHPMVTQTDLTVLPSGHSTRAIGVVDGSGSGSSGARHPETSVENNNATAI